MIYVNKLDEKNLNKFNDCMNNYVKKRDKKFIISKIEYNDPIKKAIIEKSIEQLKNNSITNYDKNCFYIEFHQKNNYFDEKVNNFKEFTWHKDDGAVTNYNVYTIIFYIRKDYSVKGGDFKYKIKGKEYTHYVKKGDIILFRGDLIHKPTETFGFGCRDSIIVFIKRV